MTRVMWLAGFVSGMFALGALTTSGASARAQQAPKALGEVGELGENVYDLVKAKDWAKAAEKYEALKGEAKQLAGELKGAKAEKARLSEAIKALGKAVATKDRMAALRRANQVTLIVADLSEPFKPRVPAAVTLLDVYGRELELGAEAKDETQLKAAVDGLRKNWDKVKATVKARGGKAEAERFDALMAQLDTTTSAEAYGKIAKTILDEVDNLEKVFSK